MEVDHNMAKKAAPKKPMTKSELLGAIATDTELSKKEVSAVLESLSGQISKSLKRRGAGSFTLPGLLKIEKKKVPARKARKGVPNPFKPGELMDVAAKPASTKVKVRPLKNLKQMV
jgi:nucleoid DNA-binding protein